MKILIERIKKVLEDSGLNQKEFAEKLGVSPNFLTELFKGRAKSPSANTIGKLATEFNISPTWLITGEGPMHIPKEITESLDLMDWAMDVGYDVEDQPRLKATIDALRSLDKDGLDAVDTLLRALDKKAHHKQAH